MSAELFNATKRWGRWGEDDDRGALNLLTPERVTKAAALVRDGVTVPCHVGADVRVAGLAA